MRVPSRRQAVAVAAALALFGLAACQPPPPPPLLAVNTTAAGADAAPGDGICEATPGGNDCTLPAALAEGNALGRAEIVLPAYWEIGGEYPALVGSVTGSIDLHADTATPPPGQSSVAHLAGVDLLITAGASLKATGITFQRGSIDVQGALVGDRISIESRFENGAPPTIHVASSGLVLLQNASITSTHDNAAVANGGTAVLHYSTIESEQWAQALVTSPGGTTTLLASAIMLEPATIGLYPDHIACAGATPISQGYNAANDTTCGFSQPGDVQAPAMTIGVLGGYSLYGPYKLDDARLDGIPQGVAGCGTTMVIAGNFMPRPFDGDGDGQAACDIGYSETQSVPAD